MVRFSIGGGNPDIPDTSKTVRGIGIEYQLPDGSKQHMTSGGAQRRWRRPDCEY